MEIKHYVVMAALFVSACSRKETNDNSRFKVDAENSAVKWKGSAPTHFHEGAFKLSGTLDLNDKNRIVSGDFSIPIASITNFDLSEPEKTTLLNHLKGSDFFNLAIHPEASFKITKAEDYTGTGTGINTKITGDLTLIGQTHSISFPAEIKLEQNKLLANGRFKLNRLQWGMNKFNDPNDPQALYILPDVDITLDIVGVR